MTNTQSPHFSHNSSPTRTIAQPGQQPRRGVWQDNPTPPRAPAASPQPAPAHFPLRPQQMRRNSPRGQKQSTHNRQTIHTTLHLKPRVRAELERVAGLRNLSISATGAELVEWALEQDLQTQHGVLLEAIVDKAIGKHMRSYSNRLAVLLVRSLFTAEQTRSFAVNILRRQPRMSDAELTEIKNGASSTARVNITRISPQLQTLLDKIKAWLEEGEEEVNVSG